MIIDDSGQDSYMNRLLIGTPTTGLVRIEWVGSRYGQVIPCNWSMVGMHQFVNAYVPLRYQVADAQNLCVRAAIEGEFEWLLLYEHDVLPPPDTFIRLNEYIRREEIPVVSGLYFSRSIPSEPLIYRGRGTSYHTDWKLGDRVWVDGVPTGLMLIHCGILRAMWEDAEEYELINTRTRRVFHTPRDIWYSPDTLQFHTATSTSDLHWCTQVMEGDYLRKAGWGKFVDGLEDPRYPFLCDTQLFCRHIDPDGRIYPSDQELLEWQPEEEAEDGREDTG